MWTKRLLAVCLSVALGGGFGALRAAEAVREGEGAKGQPAAEAELWSRYFEKNLWPTPAELQQAVGQIDQELRRRGTSYQEMLATQRISEEDHRSMLRRDLAKQKLIADIQSKIKPEEIKAEYDAHPDWYDGSKIHLSQIFVDTSKISNDPEALQIAKQRIGQAYAKLVAGADFDAVAREYSEGGAGNGMGGDRGWFLRKGADVDELFMAAVWNLKVGEFTKPIQGPRGWHILKVIGREPAAYSFRGSRPAIVNELTRRRLDAILGELKAAAKIEIYP